MESDQLIPVESFYLHYEVETVFITALYDLQLIEFTVIDNKQYIEPVHLPHVEKLLRLHKDFNLDADALSVAAHLLQKVDNLQTEITTLRSRLRLYE